MVDGTTFGIGLESLAIVMAMASFATGALAVEKGDADRTLWIVASIISATIAIGMGIYCYPH